MKTKKFQRNLINERSYITTKNSQHQLFVCKLRNSWPQSDTYNINLYKTPTNLVFEVKTNSTIREEEQQVLGKSNGEQVARLASFVNETR